MVVVEYNTFVVVMVVVEYNTFVVVMVVVEYLKGVIFPHHSHPPQIL